jgi:hypothetical protein
MPFIHEKSSIAVLSLVDLFGVPPTQGCVERDIETEHRPLSTLSNTSCIEFNVITAPDEYMRLDESFLTLKVRVKLVKKTDGAWTADHWEGVVPVQYLLHSLFKQVDVTIGQRDVTLSPQTYAHRSYLEALLGYSKEAKDSHLQSAFWMDAKDRETLSHPTDKTQPEGKIIDLAGKLHLDLAFQGRAILGGCNLKIKLIPNDPSFYLMANSSVQPYIEILDANLMIHRSKVTPNVYLPHQKALASTSSKYPLTRVEVKPVAVQRGSLDAMLDNVVTGQLPRRIFVCCVDNDAFNGSYAKDPFYFGHNNIKFAAAYLDGQQYPNKAYTPDFGEKLYVREFLGLFQALNQNGSDSQVAINRAGYLTGNTVFAFNFAPDLSSGCGMDGHVNTIKHGALRLQLKFSKALETPIHVLVYCEYDNVLEIDSDRQVSMTP